MKDKLKNIFCKYPPLSAKGIFIWVIAIFYFKFLLFDLIWASETTFSGFQFPIGYLTKLMFATLLAAPLLAIRRKWYVWTISVLLDIWLIANLMYFRTYFTIIPASSYGLVSNLADFQDSVWESLRWEDIVLPLTTVWLIIAPWKTNTAQVLRNQVKLIGRILALLFFGPAVIVAVYILCKGGFKKAYEDLLYDFSTCGAAVYTIPGAMAYEWVNGSVELTPAVRADIESWLAARPSESYTPPKRDKVPDNCIILLLESFESWQLNTTVEGQELTPRINSLLRDSTTYFAPHILTQVKGARSIDAQLLAHTGLLPVAYGAYSYRFPHNNYMSLDKAWKEKHGSGARSMSFTVDKSVVWNVGVVALGFGYKLFDKHDFILDVKTGPRGRLGDHSLMRQSLAKFDDPMIWNPQGGNLAQIVTYSGHTPFIIPDSLKKVHFSTSIPERLRHYMEVANYTDRAVGDFISAIQSNPRYANTMIVILGDHEGLGADRKDYLKDPIVGKYIDDEWYTPLIVINSPVGGRNDALAGQVDLYPTLLDLLGLWDYSWHGLGQSILDPTRKAAAMHPMKGRVVGDTRSLTPVEKSHLENSYRISDLIIATDYFDKIGK